MPEQILGMIRILEVANMRYRPPTPSAKKPGSWAAVLGQAQPQLHPEFCEIS